jgi:fatty acid desaturase
MRVPGRLGLIREWPTWVTLAGCYTIWFASLVWHDVLGWWWMIAATPMVTLHSSLQHEALHGHPTNSKRINELLVFPAVGLLVPYRSFRDTHLRHHNDANLTDPFDDPETWYLARADWQRTGSVRRAILNINNTLAGRFIMGPLLGLAGFWRSELRAVLDGDSRVRRNWIAHALGVVPVAVLIAWTGVPVWQYLLVAYVGLSVLMIRTFIEHRASETTPGRTAVIEAGPVMRLLFLNNNYHAVHHNHPTLAWYQLPALWAAERAATLEANQHYHYAGGYLEVARHWLLRQREPVEHPFLRTEGDEPVVPPTLQETPDAPVPEAAIAVETR